MNRIIPTEVFCDNRSAVDMTSGHDAYLDPLVAEYDVISEIRIIIIIIIIC
jgi:hypothetical protein